jgi:small subunit ribosomal protein S13
MGISKPKNEFKEKKEVKKEKKEKKKIKVLKKVVRLVGTDLDGEKPVIHAIRKIKGIGHTMAKAICVTANIDPKIKLGDLKENELKKLEEIIKDPIKFGIPSFLANRRKDRETGKDIHLISSDLEITQKFDIKRYIELRTYRGWRHMLGQPVRGQRTRSHFRERGKVIGVVRKKARERMKKKK